MIIFGWSTYPKVIINNVRTKCDYCGVKTPQEIIRVSKTFNLFFIPVIPYSIKYYLHCFVCGGEPRINTIKKDELVHEQELITQLANRTNAILLNKNSIKK